MSYGSFESTRFIDRDEVARLLTYELCIPVVRDAMIALSRGETRQLLRSYIPLSDGRIFGVMPGTLGAHAAFGAKLISVFRDNAAQGRQSHHGLVILFDPDSGAPVCVVHGGEVTAIRTAAASAVATEALSRPYASRLAILGTGEQARTHLRAVGTVRKLDSAVIWGRSLEHAEALVAEHQNEFSFPLSAVASAEEAVADADIICTVAR